MTALHQQWGQRHCWIYEPHQAPTHNITCHTKHELMPTAGSCPPVPGFQALQGTAHDTLHEYGPSCASPRRPELSELATACLADCDCQGFAETGCLVSNATATTSPTHPDACLYRRVVPHTSIVCEENVQSVP